MNGTIGIELPFYTYGILMGTAFIIGVFIFQYNSRKSVLPRPPSIDLILLLAISGVVGSRINYIISFPQYYRSLRDCLALHEGGLVFYGGMILAVITLFCYCKIKSYSFSMVADYMVPSLALGHSIGRLGCLINECCYGSVTQSIKIYRLKSDEAGIFRHPTQLYESLYLLLLAITFTVALRSNWQEKEENRGLMAAAYLISYGLLRFFNEYLRADPRGNFFTPLNISQGQLTSIVLAICGILWICIKKKTNNQPADCGDKHNE